jgi:PEGA domain-containing protein
MLRVRLFAAAVIVLGAALAGCSSSGSDMFKSSPPPAQVLQFQSVPAGANVQTAQGQTCSTPCSLAVPVTGQAVSFSMNGYVPQTVQLAVHQAEGSWFSTPPPDLVPNPVVAALQALPPPPPPRKVVKPRPRGTVARPRPAAPRPASMQGPTEPAIAAPEQAPAQDNVFPPPPPTSASPFPPPPTR